MRIVPLFGILLVAALSACGRPPAQTVSPAQAIADTFLAEHGQDFEGCALEMGRLTGPGERATYRNSAGMEGAPVRRLVIALDSSGSMAARVGGASKLEVAKTAARAFLATAPEGVEVGLVVFGHKGTNDAAGKAASCKGVEAVYPMSVANADRIDAGLSGFRAAGWTPLADAIAGAGAMFTAGGAPGEQIVYVVSDGKETCGGDPVAAARALHEGDVKAVINIIGFDLAAADRAELEAVARAGGGVFEEALDAQQLLRVAEQRRMALNYRERNETVAENYRRANANAATYYRIRNEMNACFFRARNAESADWYRTFNARGAADRKAHEVNLETARKIVFARHDVFKSRMDAMDARARAEFKTKDKDIRAVIEGANKDLEAVRPPGQ